MYVGKYYGCDNLRIGKALSGNSALLDGGTVSAAVHIQALTSDMLATKILIEGRAHNQGFASIAQAIALCHTFEHGAKRRRANN